ncbi:MAG: hypothetical protein JWO99_131 [Candidatus Saccharibacteria bacterium]|nr:hypothetical protein [Candidatus Saccharibacteria bacterium]
MAVLGGWRLTRTGLLFVVGILVLGGLVTGGVFLVKNHGEAVRRDQAVKVAEQNLKDQSQVATQPVNADNSSSSANSDAAKTDSTSTTTDSSSTTTTTGSTATALPETGIDDFKTLGSALIVAILAFSVASYVASRRASSRP